jgi:ATP-dependent RNA helicase DDX5/DBP2
LAQRDRLIKHLEKIMDDKNSKCLIFTGTKRTADDITMFLRKDGWPCLAIHGDKQQNERDWVLNEFKTGKSPIMVATDVASRGIGMIYLHAFYFPTPFPRDALTFFVVRTVALLSMLARTRACLAYAGVCWFSPVET